MTVDKRYTIDYDMGEIFIIDNNDNTVIGVYLDEKMAHIMCDLANKPANLHLQ